MIKKRITSVVNGFLIQEPQLEIEGRRIGLAGNGAGTWRAVTNIMVDGEVDVLLLVKGPEGTGWNLSLSCSDTEGEFLAAEGTTNSKGSGFFVTSVQSGCPEVN